MKVLVATDGSAAAAVGIRLVAGLPCPSGSTIRVVSAVDTGTALFGGPWPAAALAESEAIATELRAAATRAVAGAVGPLRRPDLTVETAVIEGRAAPAIVEEAERLGADLIVVGARGHGTVERMLLGSVSAEVLDLARIPVIVARRAGATRVVLAWDGSPAADRAATILEGWPVFAGSSVRVVTVTEPATPWWVGATDPGATELIPAILDAIDAERADRQRINAAMVDRLRAAGVAADGETREGPAAEEILAAATAAGAELIVAGTHGRTGLARVAMGSVARNLVNHAACSVLVVRGPAASDAGSTKAGSTASA